MAGAGEIDLGLAWSCSGPDLLCAVPPSQSTPSLSSVETLDTVRYGERPRGQGQVKPTLEGFGTNIIHAPADQSHQQSQKHQKDPVFP